MLDFYSYRRSTIFYLKLKAERGSKFYPASYLFNIDGISVGKLRGQK